MEVCKKVTTKKRSTFDSRQQRQVADGESDPNSMRPLSSSNKGISHSKVINSKVNSLTNHVNGSTSKSNWREQHEEFIRTVRAAKAYKPEKESKTSSLSGSNEESANKKTSTRKVSANDTYNNSTTTTTTIGKSSVTTSVNGKRIPPGYVQCPTCERNFNRKAAERHIEWCAEKKAQSARIPNTKSEAMAKLKARTNYDPNKKRKSIGTSNEITNGSSNLLTRSSVSTLDLKARSPVMSNTRRTQSKSSTSTLDLRSRQNHRSASPELNSRKKYTNHHHSSNASQAESKVKAFLESNRIRAAPKTPVVKFKEKFPPNDSSITTQYIGNHETLQELLKRPDNQNRNQMPKTVPGVRTGGMSPVKSIGGFENGDSNNGYKNGSSMTTSQTANNNGSNIFSSNFDRMMRSLDDLMLGPAGSFFRDRGTRSSPSGSSGSDGRGSSNGAGDVLTCHACGTKYPMSMAKYCFECGTRRLTSVASIS